MYTVMCFTNTGRKTLRRVYMKLVITLMFENLYSIKNVHVYMRKKHN